MLKMYLSTFSTACLIKRHHDRDDDHNVDETPSCEGNVEMFSNIINNLHVVLTMKERRIIVQFVILNPGTSWHTILL